MEQIDRVVEVLKDKNDLRNVLICSARKFGPISLGDFEKLRPRLLNIPQNLVDKLKQESIRDYASIILKSQHGCNFKKGVECYNAIKGEDEESFEALNIQEAALFTLAKPVPN